MSTETVPCDLDNDIRDECVDELNGRAKTLQNGQTGSLLPRSCFASSVWVSISVALGIGGLGLAALRK